MRHTHTPLARAARSVQGVSAAAAAAAAAARRRSLEVKDGVVTLYDAQGKQQAKDRVKPTFTVEEGAEWSVGRFDVQVGAPMAHSEVRSGRVFLHGGGAGPPPPVVTTASAPAPAPAPAKLVSARAQRSALR